MSNTQQPEALNLEEFRAKVTRAAREPLLARIEELEAQLSAIGAGGVEPLRKAAATPIAWYVTGCSTMLDEHDAKAEAKRCGGSTKAVPLYTVPRRHAATQPAAQGVELANCKGDNNWLTVVYRDIQPGDESRAIGEHPKVSALSWSHALHDRDAALAAKAKQGGAA